MKLLSIIGSLALSFSVVSHAQSLIEDCKKDLEFIPVFLLENDSGARDHLVHHGQNTLDAAFRKTSDEINSISTETQCDAQLKNYLLNWRKDHINIRSTRLIVRDERSSPQNTGVSLKPEIEFLSKETVLLVIPSFRFAYKQSIEDLLKENETQLEESLNWIIDVRRNGGGSDSSYETLLTWFISSEVINVDTSWLVTPINIEANASICQRAAPNDPSCKSMMDTVVSLMRATKNGEFTSTSTPFSYHHYNFRESATRRRVAILMDKNCGSTCEQFLLTARQSFNVKLLGRNSAGALDYSNLRPYPLPSGKRDLIYAVSRSHRLPIMPVDVSGVSPDILLPTPNNEEDMKLEINKVKNWLEGGSLEINNK